jgi:hypothetical protein
VISLKPQNQKSTDANIKSKREAKSRILSFITENSGQYYEVGLQMKFPNYSAEYLRTVLKQLEAEHRITNNSGLSPYRVV